jgi:hypothetical protein
MRLQRLMQHGGVHLLRKVARATVRREKRLDDVARHTFGAACRVYRARLQIDVDVAESIEHGTNASPVVRTQRLAMLAVIGSYHAGFMRRTFM